MADTAARAIRVAVIGAGPAGLMAARTLADGGVSATVLDKGRRVGGRTASRRLDDGVCADHGAPWFRVREARLTPYVESWCADGVLAPWFGADEGEAYVGSPHARALAEHLAAGLPVVNAVDVRHLSRDGDGWRLHLNDGAHGPFDRVVAAIPAPQAARLLHEFPALAGPASRVTYTPCFTAMVRFAAPLARKRDVVRGPAPLVLGVRDSAKPGRRGDGETWVLHASAAWSDANLDADPHACARSLLDAFGDGLDGTCPEPVSVIGHRWRYAQPHAALDVGAVVDADAGIAACGDWCRGGDVAGALLSGMTAAACFATRQPDPDAER